MTMMPVETCVFRSFLVMGVVGVGGVGPLTGQAEQ